MANNVLFFPETNRVKSVDDVYSKIQNVKNTHIDESLELIIPMLINQFMLLGFNFDYMNNAKDISLIAESIKSLLMKYYDMNHPIQSIIDKLVIEDETLGYIVSDDLRVLKKIKKEKKIDIG